MAQTLTDSYGRQIRDLRISVTDRCNFRCFYCLPESENAYAQKESILTFEELETAAKAFVQLGIQKIRLTGGEPMLRKDLEVLVEKIAALKSDGLIDLALTTNGHTFAKRAAGLKAAGLDRVTISLDSLKHKTFQKITGHDRLNEALGAIEAAKSAGLSPVKVNAVIVRGWNEHEVADLAAFARESGVSMRFIEYMPLDSGQDWRREDVVSGKEIYAAINAKFPLKLKQDSRGNETAWKYAFADGAPGEIGIIAPVTEMFCGQCSRIRLTADGQIRTCLFSTREYNLRDVVRNGGNIEEFIIAAVLKKEPRHYINDRDFVPASRSMSFIGG